MATRSDGYVTSSTSPEVAGAGPVARRLLRLDGVFEAVLGCLLVSAPATGLYGALGLPWPATKVVVVLFGLLLLPVLPVLWLASRAPGRPLLRLLALANGAGAMIFVLWVLIWHGSFHRAGAVFVLLVAAVLAVLSLLQGRSALARGSLLR